MSLKSHLILYNWEKYNDVVLARDPDSPPPSTLQYHKAILFPSNTGPHLLENYKANLDESTFNVGALTLELLQDDRPIHDEHCMTIVRRLCGCPKTIFRAYDHFDPNDYLKSCVVITITVRCMYVDRAMLPAMFLWHTGLRFFKSLS